MFLGFNSFLLLRDEQNSKCVCVLGGVGVQNMHIFTTNIPTFHARYKDRCLLLTSSMSFVDLTFEEHRMMKEHHMYQNPYTSSLCPKPGVVSDNTAQGDDVAKRPGPADLGLTGPTPWPASQALAPLKLRFQHVSC
jgi:hypothetical protein